MAAAGTPAPLSALPPPAPVSIDAPVRFEATAARVEPQAADPQPASWLADIDRKLSSVDIPGDDGSQFDVPAFLRRQEG